MLYLRHNKKGKILVLTDNVWLSKNMRTVYTVAAWVLQIQLLFDDIPLHLIVNTGSVVHYINGPL